MRIIAGEARGRRLEEPDGLTTRPILDALKERLFNVLGARVRERVVWDLFAGVGNLGLEALSRGAASCLFVERDRKSHAVLLRNVERLGFGDRGRAVLGDALRFTSHATVSTPDLVFLDPPFPLVAADPAGFDRVLDDLAAVTAPAALVILRTPSSAPPPQPRRFETSDQRLHGVSRVTIFVPPVAG